MRNAASTRKRARRNRKKEVYLRTLYNMTALRVTYSCPLLRYRLSRRLAAAWRARMLIRLTGDPTEHISVIRGHIGNEAEVTHSMVISLKDSHSSAHKYQLLR